MTFEKNKNNTETSKKNQIYDKNKKILDIKCSIKYCLKLPWLRVKVTGISMTEYTQLDSYINSMCTQRT